jgi:hypothetical protein
MSVEGERELEEFLAGALSGQEPKPEPEAEEPPEVVVDEPPGYEPPAEEAPPAPSADGPTDEEPADEEAEEEDANVVWATKKYGKNPSAWAKASFEMEQHISRLNDEKKNAEDVARQAIEYAQQAEAQAQSQVQMSMPLSAAEEQWVEQSMGNPGAAAYQAARAGNVQLYNAVLEAVAVDNPNMAVQIGTQVQMAMQQEMQQLQAERAQAQPQPADFNTDLGQSFQRVGVNVQRYGPAMWEKLEELGQYHKYTLAMLGGDALQRDLAVQAVYDLVRQGETTTRKVVDEDREERIRREGELRRDAASVVTGSPHHSTPQESPLIAGMKEEWMRRGQWTEDE